MQKMQAPPAPQSPLCGHHQLLIQRPKSGRKPLQPKINSPAATTNTKPKPHQRIEIFLPIDHDDYSNNNNNNNDNNNNKENIPPPPNYYSTVGPVDCVKKNEFFPIESLDASLADELSAIREKLDRLRIDKEETEDMLKERVVMLDLKMKEILQRGEVQKQLEIEVDRLYRLNEIRLASLRISPIRTLRDKEQEKKIKQQQQDHQLKANNNIASKPKKGMNLKKEESPFQSPKSEEAAHYREN